MGSRAKSGGRKEEKRIPPRRGEAVVKDILAATLEELAQTGYRALRVEDVAARAGVNKTTVYRRWPEKSDLVHAAFRTIARSHFTGGESSGSLRQDLLSKGRSFAQFAMSSHGRSLVRMMFIEGSDPELRDIFRMVRASHASSPQEAIAKAIERGELSSSSDAQLLLESFVGAIYHRIFVLNEAFGERELTSLVDLLLNGALSPLTASARKRASTKD